MGKLIYFARSASSQQEWISLRLGPFCAAGLVNPTIYGYKFWGVAHVLFPGKLTFSFTIFQEISLDTAPSNPNKSPHSTESAPTPAKKSLSKHAQNATPHSPLDQSPAPSAEPPLSTPKPEKSESESTA